MSKITKPILMLNLLHNKRKWHISELSEKLEVTDRMVRYYKSCLEEAGFNIISFKGKDGGYFLASSELNERLNLTDEDIDKISKISKEKDIEIIVDKIKSNFYSDKNKYFSILNRKNKDYGKLEEDFVSAIINDRKIKIVYKGNSERITIRIVKPIDLFYYDNAIFLLAYCELRKSIRNFEFDRIISYEIK